MEPILQGRSWITAVPGQFVSNAPFQFSWETARCTIRSNLNRVRGKSLIDRWNKTLLDCDSGNGSFKRKHSPLVFIELFPFFANFVVLSTKTPITTVLFYQIPRRKILKFISPRFLSFGYDDVMFYAGSVGLSMSDRDSYVQKWKLWSDVCGILRSRVNSVNLLQFPLRMIISEDLVDLWLWKTFMKHVTEF